MPEALRGILFLVLGTKFAILCLVACFAPRKGWGRGINLVIIALGCSSCLTLPAALPLLVRAMKPEVKGWYRATGV